MIGAHAKPGGTTMEAVRGFGLATAESAECPREQSPKRRHHRQNFHSRTTASSFGVGCRKGTKRTPDSKGTVATYQTRGGCSIWVEAFFSWWNCASSVPIRGRVTFASPGYEVEKPPWCNRKHHLPLARCFRRRCRPRSRRGEACSGNPADDRPRVERLCCMLRVSESQTHV